MSEYLSRADGNAGKTADAFALIQHNNALGITAESESRADFNTFAALIADSQVKSVIFIKDSDTGFFRVFFFEEQLGAYVFAGMAANTFFRIGFQVFHSYLRLICRGKDKRFVL